MVDCPYDRGPVDLRRGLGSEEEDRGDGEEKERERGLCHGGRLFFAVWGVKLEWFHGGGRKRVFSAVDITIIQKYCFLFWDGVKKCTKPFVVSYILQTCSRQTLQNASKFEA